MQSTGDVAAGAASASAGNANIIVYTRHLFCEIEPDFVTFAAGVALPEASAKNSPGYDRNVLSAIDRCAAARLDSPRYQRYLDVMNCIDDSDAVDWFGDSDKMLLKTICAAAKLNPSPQDRVLMFPLSRLNDDFSILASVAIGLSTNSLIVTMWASDLPQYLREAPRPGIGWRLSINSDRSVSFVPADLAVKPIRFEIEFIAYPRPTTTRVIVKELEDGIFVVRDIIHFQDLDHARAFFEENYGVKSPEKCSHGWGADFEVPAFLL